MISMQSFTTESLLLYKILIIFYFIILILYKLNFFYKRISIILKDRFLEV